MEATAILEYFAPLYDWLIRTNEQNGVEVGWELTYGNWRSINFTFTNNCLNLRFEFLQNVLIQQREQFQKLQQLRKLQIQPL